MKREGGRASWRQRLRGCQLLLGTLALLTLSTGCIEEVAPADHVAELDGEPILYASFEEFLQRNAIDDAGVLGSDILSSLLDQFLDEQMLCRLAREDLGLVGVVDGRAAADALLADTVDEIAPAEVADFYQRHRERFDLPERIFLRQLLFIDRQEAEQAQAIWAGGEPYRRVVDSLAEEYSSHVGEEGEFARDDLPPALADILFELEEGEVSEVLAAEYGFHVFQVVQKLPAGVAPLAAVEAGIRDDLLLRRRQVALDQLVERARERYNVRVFGRNVPFNYHGRFQTRFDQATR